MNKSTPQILASTLEGKPLFKPNDLAFDSAGNLIFTCPGDSRSDPTGYVAILEPDGSVERVASGFYFPNGPGAPLFPKTI